MELVEFFYISAIIFIWLSIVLVIYIAVKINQFTKDLEKIKFKLRKIPLSFSLLTGQLQVFLLQGILSFFNKRGGGQYEK